MIIRIHFDILLERLENWVGAFWDGNTNGFSSYLEGRGYYVSIGITCVSVDVHDMRSPSRLNSCTALVSLYMLPLSQIMRKKPKLPITAMQTTPDLPRISPNDIAPLTPSTTALMKLTVDVPELSSVKQGEKLHIGSILSTFTPL